MFSRQISILMWLLIGFSRQISILMWLLIGLCQNFFKYMYIMDILSETGYHMKMSLLIG